MTERRISFKGIPALLIGVYPVSVADPEINFGRFEWTVGTCAYGDVNYGGTCIRLACGYAPTRALSMKAALRASHAIEAEIVASLDCLDDAEEADDRMASLRSRQEASERMRKQWEDQAGTPEGAARGGSDAL